MKVIDLLKLKRPTLSFEFFPPKDEMGFWDLYRTIASLKPLEPSYVTVTYGAGGTTRRRTIDLVAKIRADVGIETVAHLTCVGSTKAELAGILAELAQKGMENILALRGDPPDGSHHFAATEGGFGHANELVGFVREHYPFYCLGAACYPEVHPEAPNAQVDLENLKRKVDAGADFLISQLFFDNEHFYRFRDRAVAVGIKVPIIAGIMPILSVSQVKRFTEMCGASIPPDLADRMESLADDREAVQHVGMYHATNQCLDLINHGVAGIHFYTLNKSTATRAIYQFIKSELR
jgi:methylenetetrahydrofolate reductase (NADPH)